MMGRLKSDQGQLFYEFHLGDAVPEDHLVRKIDGALDLSWLRSELAPHYSLMGRPSIDPELMIRMLVVGYVFAIRSERLICREVQVNLAYRWFCKLGIEDAVPDHSAFSRARNERFREGDVFRRMFERVVEACIAAGLVGGEGFAVDASLIQADANKQRSIAGQDWRKDRDPARSSRAVKEYLATLDDTAWGSASDVVPKFVSPSDPAAQWTGAHKGPAFFAYSDNYLIDVKFGVIVDVEASRSIRQAEVGAAKTMIERTEERFGLKPERLVGDTAYGAAPMLNWLVEEKGIAPHIPVFDKSKRDDGTFSRSDFRYDPPATSTTVQAESGSERAAPCTKARRFCTAPASSTAMHAHSNRSAAQRNQRARSRATSMSTPETLPVRLRALKPSSSHAVSARRSRCGSPTSSAS
jgi:transposase